VLFTSNQQTLLALSQASATLLLTLVTQSANRLSFNASCPPRLEKTSCPGVRFWRKKDWTGHIKARKGETNRNGASLPQHGQPRDDSDSDSDGGSDSCSEAMTKKTSTHPYLKNADGTSMKSVKLRQMSQKAWCALGALRDYGCLAEPWSDVKHDAYRYYYAMMLSDPDFIFPRFCNNGEWKLQEWTTRLFPSWAKKLHGNKREEHKTTRRPHKKMKTDIFKDPQLLTIESEEDKMATASPPQAVTAVSVLDILSYIKLMTF